MRNDKETIINGSLNNWKEWFFGKDDIKKKYSPGEFKRSCLIRAIKNLDNIYPDVDFDLKTIYNHRKTIRFELTITGNSHGSRYYKK